MPSGLYGADVAQLRELGRRFESAADKIERSGRLVGQGITTTVQWVGPSAANFRSEWAGTHHPRVDGAVATLRAAAQRVRANADEQQAASARDLDLGSLAAALSGTLAGLGTGGVRVPRPPAGANPAAANAWWKSLGKDQREKVIADHPEWIGNRDGIPAVARDQANRNLIPVYRAELEAERDRLEKSLSNNLMSHFGLPGLWTNEDRELEIIKGKLAGLEQIETVLDRGGRQLLVLDITGEQQLKAAVAVGNVDTAAHVAVYTPGFRTTVQDSMDDDDTQMAELRAAAVAQSAKYGDGGTVATVTWHGYEAPQLNEVADLPGRSVLNPSLAIAGAKDLAEFYSGINASRGTDPHLTALGYSYGSTTTGLALQHDTGVDDVVFFGSPGIGTSDLGDLRVPDGHVYAIETGDDPIADSGWYGRDPSWIEGIQGLSPAESGEYGASTGHGEYLKNQTTSQHNIAVIIAGIPERVVPG